MDNPIIAENEIVIEPQDQVIQTMVATKHMEKPMMNGHMHKGQAICLVFMILILLGIGAQVVLQAKILVQLRKTRRK